MLLLAILLPTHPQKHPAPSLNLIGSGWLTLCISAVLIALLQAEQLGYWLLLFLLVGGLAGWQLTRHEQQAQAPLFPMRLWQSKLIIAGNIGNLVIGATMMGVSAFYRHGYRASRAVRHFRPAPRWR